MSLIQADELEQILNIRILRLASKLSLIFQRESLRPANVKVQQWRILVSLAQHEELHLRALAHHSSQDPAHTSREVSAMISAGWLHSKPDRHDQRRILYTITEKGEDIVKEIWPHAKRFATDINELFDTDDVSKFKEMLDITNAFCEDRLNTDLNQRDNEVRHSQG